MEKDLFEKLDNLNNRDTDLLLEKDINLSLDYFTMKRVERSIKKKTGHYDTSSTLEQKISYILGGITMKRKIALVLSVIAVSGLSGGVYANAKTTTVAYVSLDINPSIELGVNAFNQVVSAEAYNEDGQKVLEGTELIDSDVNDAVGTVISNAASDGYIKEDCINENDAADATTTTSAAVEITVSTDKENVADKLEESLKESANKALKKNDIKAEVETENTALARRNEARQLGITPGKLNLIQKLQKLDQAITVEDYKDSSVKDIQKKTNELRNTNKSNEDINENNAETNEDTKINASINTSANAVVEESTGNSVSNNGNAKKEEKGSSNRVKEDNSIANNKEKNTAAKHEGQNSNNNLNLENKNSNKEKNKNN